jgi:hypothetical protein
LFGEQGVVDLIGVSGYYTAVSMTLNVAHVMPPDGVPLLLKPLNGARSERVRVAWMPGGEIRDEPRRPIPLWHQPPHGRVDPIKRKGVYVDPRQ